MSAGSRKVRGGGRRIEGPEAATNETTGFCHVLTAHYVSTKGRRLDVPHHNPPDTRHGRHYDDLLPRWGKKHKDNNFPKVIQKETKPRLKSPPATASPVDPSYPDSSEKQGYILGLKPLQGFKESRRGLQAKRSQHKEVKFF